MVDEFDLIEKLLSRSRRLKHQGALIIPPGDDAALLSSIARPVITTDTHREGVHFRTEWQRHQEIGKKAVVITLSDLAASFATPVALFVNLSLPGHVTLENADALYDGIFEALDQYGCALGGGNISRAGELSLDMFAIGDCYSGYYPARSGARSGDGLYVSGPIGKAKAGLLALIHNDPDFPELVRAFKFPEARFDAAKILYAHGVRCVMDLSDGLIGDASHMARASSVTITLDPAALRLPPELTLFSRKYNLSPEKVAFEGGEEYELLFTCTPDVFARIENQLPSAFQVGIAAPFSETYLIQPFPEISSFQHGKKSY
jgi:thiamine-monophosphate kinase